MAFVAGRARNVIIGVIRLRRHHQVTRHPITVLPPGPPFWNPAERETRVGKRRPATIAAARDWPTIGMELPNRFGLRSARPPGTLPPTAARTRRRPAVPGTPPACGSA